MKIKVINKSQNQLPLYATQGSVAVDLKASISPLDNIFKGENFIIFDDHIKLKPSGRILIPTDLYVEIPEGYEIQVRARSGLIINSGIYVHLGTIDNDYRGNIGIIIINLGSSIFEIRNGDRLAQAVLNKVEQIEWKELTDINDLSKTKRGEGGYGSTGK